MKCKAIFDNNEEVLFPNQFVNARVLVRTEQGATTVPNVAIQRSPQSTFVYVVSDDAENKTKIAKLRTVQIKITNETTSVVDGISPGDKVVVDGLDKLQDGAQVVLPDAGAGPARRPAS